MDIQEIIKNRYKELPADIQQAITSTDLAGKFETVAKKHGLHVDQNGYMQTETVLVMLGLENSEDFVGNLQTNLNISKNEAISIAEDINTEILNSIKNSLKRIQEQQALSEKDSVTSSIEKAGDFTLIKEEAKQTLTHSDDNMNKAELLTHIEDQPISLVDHLLTAPVNNPEKIEVKKVEEKKEDTIDPYREQM